MKRSARAGLLRAARVIWRHSGRALVVLGLLCVLLGGLVSPRAVILAAPNTWSATGSMTTARRFHTATLLPNGQVLVAGGYSGATYLNSAELYNPATGAWTPTGSMTTARWQHTATLLPNGQVLVAGGWNGSVSLSSAELYNPATGAWTSTGSMTTGRHSATATLLPNGQVLVAGGSHNTAGDLNSAELYNPATSAWTPTSSMITGHEQYAATLLPNGQVLVTAGFNNTDSVSSAELYGDAAPLPCVGAACGPGTATPEAPSSVLFGAGAALVLLELGTRARRRDTRQPSA